MKKLFVVTLSAITILSLSACGKKTTTIKKRNTVDVLESDLETQITNVAEYLDDATFCVLNYTTTESETASSLGSGVIYKKVINENNSYTYYLVTNRHVVEDGDKFKIYSSSGSTVQANVLGYSNNYDIAVLTFTTYDVHNVVPFANINDVKQGQYCFAMGTPLYMTYVNTFTSGNVSAIRSTNIQHTADINAGNSGGPLVNLNGELIGINVSKLSTNQIDKADIDGMCMAIRCDKVEEAIDEIEGKSSATINPLLGMTVIDVGTVKVYDYDTFDLFWSALKKEFVDYYTLRGYSEEYVLQKFEDLYASKKEDYLKNYNDLHAFNVYIPESMEEGMLVRNVFSDSVTDLAGIKIGDIVIGLNDKEIKKQSEFALEFYKYNVGDTLNIKVLRDGVEKTIQVKL